LSISEKKEKRGLISHTQTTFSHAGPIFFERSLQISGCFKIMALDARRIRAFPIAVLLFYKTL